MADSKEPYIDATDNLVNQQFYREGSDTIIGRTPEVKVKIKYSGQIIAKFKSLFNENLDLFCKDKFFEFLRPFTTIKGITDEILEEVHEEMERKLETLKDSGVDKVVIYTIVLSTLISKIRDLHFQDSLDEIKDRVQDSKAKVSEEHVEETLNNLFMRNNDNISLLYSLSYLDALAESFNYSTVARTCKIQKGKYINRVVDLILDSHK